MTAPTKTHTGAAASRYLTVGEVAELLRQPVATLRYWRHLGKGPKGFRVGRRVLYDRSDVEQFLAESRQAEVAGGGLLAAYADFADEVGKITRLLPASSARRDLEQQLRTLESRLGLRSGAPGVSETSRGSWIPSLQRGQDRDDHSIATP